MAPHVFLSLVIFLFTCSSSVLSDDMRPASLIINQIGDVTYLAKLKLPASGKATLNLDVDFGQNVKAEDHKSAFFIQGAYIRSWQLTLLNDTPKLVVSILGLEKNSVDVLVRFSNLQGQVSSQLMNLDTPNLDIELAPEHQSSTFIQYVYYGIEHILIGADHLLFVLCLVFISRTRKELLWTITGFTLAHSITLFLSALEWIYVPIAPVEAVIALSIIFLSTEILRGNSTTITMRYPIMASASFGLLHGFGFASVLADLGLPEQQAGMALLAFNLGVEIGQLIFVLVLLIAFWSLCKLRILSEKTQLTQIVGYSCGMISTVWFVQRIINFSEL